MSPETTFLLTLVLRMAITAAFVVTASIITERSGPVIGALIATLPISAGPSYVFLALDHDAAFIAEGALASLPINAATIGGAADRLGSLDKGKIANVIVTDGDLFEEKTAITHVFVNGRPVTLPR